MKFKKIQHFNKMENKKALLMYQKISIRLDTVKAIISQMTLHEINQRSDYLESQVEYG
jgi:hypothetical protein